MTNRISRTIIATLATITAVAVVVALAANSMAGAPEPKRESPGAALTSKQQHELRGLRTRARAASNVDLGQHFGLFRRVEQPGDQVPGAEAGDKSRKVKADDGTDVYVFQRGGDICGSADGGVACGPAGQATTFPVVFGHNETDGSVVMYSPVADDVTDAAVTTTSGDTVRVKPRDNLYTVKLPHGGHLTDVVLTHADGSKQHALKH